MLRITRYTTSIFLLILIVILTSGCTTIQRPEQSFHNSFVPLNSENQVGQTFVARFDGLSGVGIFLKPEISGDGNIILSLSYKPDEKSEIDNSSIISVSKITSPGYYFFTFDSQAESANQYYYINIEIIGDGKVQVGAGEGGTYLNGALYQNNYPQDAQMTFYLRYDSGILYLGLIKEALNWLIILIVSLWLYILPGWALLMLVLPDWEKTHWSAKFGLSAGVSLAAYPILLLWTDLIGMHLGVLYAWLLPTFGLIIIGWKSRSTLFITKYRINAFVEGKKALIHKLKSPNNLLPNLVIFFILFMIISSRFWAIRNLDAPMWGDSYQHTVMAQLIIDQNGLFESWEPYVPYTSLTVHFGFSAIVAVFSWFMNIPILQATLITGQIMNVLAVISLIPLISRFGVNPRWSGVGVLLVAGLVSTLPAYYVNWGRYAQLTGLATLPTALYLTWKVVGDFNYLDFGQELGIKAKGILITSLTVSGMLLGYYRMIFYYFFFLVAWVLIYGFTTWHLKANLWKKSIITQVIIGIVSMIFFSPWISRLFGSNLANSLSLGVSKTTNLENVLNDYRAWLDINAYLPTILIILSIFALVIATIQKKWIIYILPLWYILLTGFISGRLFHIPGANMMQSFAILISIYIPSGVLVGWLFGTIANSSLIKEKLFRIIALSILILIASLSITWKIRNISEPNTYALVLRPDIQAMQWIRQNIAEDARFLVEGFSIYGGNSAVGSDGGWWISLLAMRENTMPPQYALMNERPEPGDYSSKVVTLVTGLENNPLNSNNGVNILCENQITHIYIGQGQGEVGYNAKPLFTTKMLSENVNFKLVYNQDRVFIYSILPEVCSNSYEAIDNKVFLYNSHHNSSSNILYRR